MNGRERSDPRGSRQLFEHLAAIVAPQQFVPAALLLVIGCNVPERQLQLGAVGVDGSAGTGGVPDASVTGGSGGSSGSAGTGGAGASAGTGGAGATAGAGGAGAMAGAGGAAAAGGTGAAGTGATAGTGGAMGAGGLAGMAGAAGAGGAGGVAGSAGSAGIAGGAGNTGKGGTSGAGGSAGTAGAGAAGGSAGMSGTGGAAGADGGAGKGGASGASGSGGAAGSGGTTGACTSYVPDSTYPCVMTPPAGCGANPNNCGTFVCPPNTMCGTGTSCSCVAGYIPIECASGLRCTPSVPCPGGTWGCVLTPDPGCTGNPSQTQGVCSCSNGKTYNLMCGGTITCEEHCRQGS
jgi:hypothetical protein